MSRGTITSGGAPQRDGAILFFVFTGAWLFVAWLFGFFLGSAFMRGWGL